jgi:hypothetical protein
MLRNEVRNPFFQCGMLDKSLCYDLCGDAATHGPCSTYMVLVKDSLLA